MRPRAHAPRINAPRAWSRASDDQSAKGAIMGVLVGKAAPDFTAAAVMPDNSIEERFNLLAHLGISRDRREQEKKGKIGLLFFYPLDSTFVCPSEILAFNNRVKEFKLRKCELIAVSVDSQFS